MQLVGICNPLAVEDTQKLLQRVPVTGLCTSIEEVRLCHAMLAVVDMQSFTFAYTAAGNT